jgi:hypothetical protein
VQTGATEIKWTHQLLVYADNVILLGDNIDDHKEKYTDSQASKEVGPDVNVEKT